MYNYKNDNYDHKLTKLTIILFILLLGRNPAQAQQPAWASSYGSHTVYNQQEYLTGFGMTALSSDMTLDEAISHAEANARENLIQKVRVQVKSLTTSLIEETDEHYTSQYMSSTQSSSQLELFGLNTEHYVDQRGAMAYALSHIRRENVRDQFVEQLNQRQHDFSRQKELADRVLEGGNMNEALNQLQTAKSIYAELMSAWSVVQSVERSMPQVQRTDWHPEQIRSAIREVDQHIEGIFNRPVNSINDAAWWLANIMGAAEQEYKVDISTITYRDSDISSEFANYLRQLLGRQLSERTQWHMVQTGMGDDPTHILTGNFWDRGDEVHILLNVRDISTGKIEAVSEVSLAQSIIEESGFVVLPENYMEAMADLAALKANEGDSRGLDLKVWTTKGEKSLVFEEGELMEVSLQVNLPSYVRIIYHLNDGKRVLLVDSYFINARSVNKPYTLPYQFECAPPFGVEMMQVIAQSEPFEMVSTKVIDGLPYLTDDLNNFLTQTRGFKIKKQEAQQTEEVLTITTMARSN